jgi:hypothetical protein
VAVRTEAPKKWIFGEATDAADAPQVDMRPKV